MPRQDQAPNVKKARKSKIVYSVWQCLSKAHTQVEVSAACCTLSIQISFFPPHYPHYHFKPCGAQLISRLLPMDYDAHLHPSWTEFVIPSVLEPQNPGTFLLELAVGNIFSMKLPCLVFNILLTSCDASKVEILKKYFACHFFI